SLQAHELELAPLDLGAENVALPSSLGCLLPTASAFASHRGLDLARPGRWGIVKLHGDAYFSASRVRAGLLRDAEAFYGNPPTLVDAEAAFSGAGSPLRRAQCLDDRAGCEALARELGPQVKGLDGLLFPPVLGLDRHGQVRQWLAEALGMPIVESLAHLPSVPGVRLQRGLQAALKDAGVHSLGEVTGWRQEGGALENVTTRDNLEIRAASFVLATGRFLSGGIVWRERCEEALFNLPVVTELGWLEQDSPSSVVRETPAEAHPLMTAGIKVNRRLQPIREARPAFANLFAAGMVIGNFASRYVMCADGVALATGWLAGTHALSAARGG
ncbi:MAG TPA: FAD-binding protein, partial [Myxococcota bacterium]|nr:FAD-binding protein [Myxococcota bacterium]